MRVQQSGGTRQSSFFPDNPASHNSSSRGGLGAAGGGSHRAPGVRTRHPNAVEEILQREALVQSARDLRLVAPFAPSESAPQWDRAQFVPSEDTRAAFE
jgi:hypothetical protein